MPRMPVKGNKSNGPDRGTEDYFDYMRTVLKGKSDPIWFVNNIMGVELFPKQEEIMREFYKSRYDPSQEQIKTLIVLAGMRSGKTALASIMAVYEFFDLITIDNPSEHYGLLKDQPIFITVVATSEKLAEDGVFTNMVNYINNTPWFHKYFTIKITGGRIECAEKHVIAQVLGSWVTTAVGRSNYLVVFDEMDLFEDTAGKRGSWELWTRLGNSTATFGLDGHKIAISSPKTASGIMMQLYRDSERMPNTLGFMAPTWEMNPHLTRKQLMDEHKYNMAAFWRDFACQPEAAGGMQFPEGVYLTQMTNVLENLAYKDKTPKIRVMAIDPAVRNDSFGVAVGYREFNNIVIDGVYKFEKKEGNSYILPSDVESYIYTAIPRLNVNYFVYDTWMFPNLIEDVSNKFGITAEKHIVRKEDYDRWRALQENPGEMTLSVVYNEDLKFEANSLIVKSTASQLPKTDHPFTGSKDMSDCVANCIWYLTTYEMPVLIPDVLYIRSF
ncbi:MAG: hypothetical protein M0R51_15195 [Clostridia bacterium]|nr:hypothetical protein [Clostridia bacterium]